MMSEFYENYTEGPQNGPKSPSGTTPFVLGLLSIILSLSFSRLAGIVLGIIAIVLGGRLRYTDSEAKAGFIMGIIGLCLGLCIVALVVIALTPLFISWFFLPWL